MNYNLTNKEIKYLMGQLDINRLTGYAGWFSLAPITSPIYDEIKKSLIEKGYISIDGKDVVISANVKRLMSLWANIKYSISNQRTMSKDFFSCSLFDGKDVLILQRDLDNYYLEASGALTENISNAINAVTEISEVDCKDNYIIQITTEELNKMLNEKTDSNYELFSKKTGVKKAEIENYFKVIDSTDGNFSVSLAEDYENRVSCLIKIVNENDGIYMLKQSKNQQFEKNVLVKGNKQYIIDSIFNM